MSAFQIVSLSAVGLAGLAVFVGLARGGLRRRDALWLSLALVAAAVALAWPESTSAVARALGIGRGADLLLYVSVFAMGAGFLGAHVRMRRTERALTEVVRALALEDAEERYGSRD